jgi:ubiquinone/menaquinone biosynthesis C-methylase UbiE
MRNWIAAIAIAMILAAFCVAQDNNYKQTLIEKYPFYKSATTILKPVYAALARQFVADFGIKDGICVDVGGGSGSLSLALAKTTDLTCYVVDLDPAAVRLCGIEADEAKLTGRVRALEGDAQNLPLRDNFANLVVSRGSIFFWQDQLQGLKEAYRILKPGGVAFVGCGVSRLLDAATRNPILAWRKETVTKGGHKSGWHKIDPDLVERCKSAGNKNVRMVHEPDSGDDYGYWIEIHK